MRKLITSIAIAAAILSGCTKEEPVTPVIPEEPVNLELTAEIPETRTYLGDITYDGNNKPVGRNVFWSTGDVVAVWSDDTPNTQNYTLSKGAGTNTGTFVYKPNAAVPSGVVGSEFYAVYPNTIVSSVTNNTAKINLPLTQSCNTAETTNFASGVNPMAAIGTVLSRADGKGGMTFHNLCGILVVKVTADQDLTVGKIVLNCGQALCGDATLTFNGVGEAPTLKVVGSDELTLRCDGCKLSANESKEFYIVVPAATYDYMTISIHTNRVTTGPSLQKTRRTSMTIDAGQITNVGADLRLITKEPVKYKIGDAYPDATNPVGIVFALDNPTTTGGVTSGTSGKIVALEDCSKTVNEDKTETTFIWGPTTSSPTPSNMDNGLLNMDIVKPNIANYPAFDVCQSYGKGGLDWYLPAKDELQTIIDRYGILENTWRKITTPTPTEDEHLFNFEASGYWTSSMNNELAIVSVWYYSLELVEDPDTGEDARKGMTKLGKSKLPTTKYSVRAIAQFGTTK